MNRLPALSGPRFLVESAAGEVESFRFAGGRAAVCSRKAPGKETPNEDAVALVPAGPAAGVALVADGAGGLPGGRQASALAVEALARAVAGAGDEEAALRNAILNGFEAANAEVQALATGAATTLAAVEIAEGQVRPFHVGDSMVLVCGQRGRIKLQTVSHSPTGYAVEAGLLEEREALHHAERHLVSNMVGTPDMRIEVGPPVRLAPRDTVLVASDGLFDNLHLEEIVAVIRCGPLEGAAHRLLEAAVNRMERPVPGQPSKPDDLSFVLYRPA